MGRTLEKERHDNSRFISRNKSEQLLILVLADRQTCQLISAMITFYVKSGFAQGCVYILLQLQLQLRLPGCKLCLCANFRIDQLYLSIVKMNQNNR